MPADHWMVRKFFDSLRKHGPLGTCRRVFAVMQRQLNRVPGCGRLFLSLDGILCIVKCYFDRQFDRKYGVDTSDVIPLKDLTIKSKNIKDGNWYEPMSVKVFKHIMSYLTINFGEFEFIDFGSGKGRVLLLASEYGFKKIIGIEFAEELHRIATENVAIYERFTQRTINIETICMDAVEFPIPNVPVVIFFYSPFKAKVIEHVLSNVLLSLAMNPREIILIFYGQNPNTVKLFKATGFRCRELELCADWSQFTQYQGFLFTSRKSA